jgi:hypothetical protein
MVTLAPTTVPLSRQEYDDSSDSGDDEILTLSTGGGEECGAEYAERRACEEALDEHQPQSGKEEEESEEEESEEEESEEEESDVWDDMDHHQLKFGKALCELRATTFSQQVRGVLVPRTVVFSTTNGPRLTVGEGPGLQRIVFADGSAPTTEHWQGGQLVFDAPRPMVFDVLIAVFGSGLLMKPVVQYHAAEFGTTFGFPDSHGYAGCGYVPSRVIGVREGSYLCAAEYTEQQAYESALDKHRSELATGVDSAVVTWNNPATGLRTAVI